MTRAAGLLEVIALTARDAYEAEAGGADRLEVVGTMDDDGLSPEPALVEEMLRASSLPLRVMVRLRAGFGTDDAEIARLRELSRHYLEAGAEGLVLGFLTPAGDLDVAAVTAVLDGLDGPGGPGGLDARWTFHRAIDHSSDPEGVWAQLHDLPGLDQVLTAGSAAGLGDGLATLVERARGTHADRLLAGGGLRPEHVPVLAAAGVGSFHVGSAVRPGGSFSQPVDAALVRTWRTGVETAVQQASQDRTGH